MIQWGKYPLARVVLWMVFAIYTFDFLPDIPLSFYAIIIAILLALGLYAYWFKVIVLKNTCTVFLIYFLTVFNTAFHSPVYQKEHILNQQEVDLYEVKISEDLYPTQNGYRSTGDILKVFANDSARQTNGGILLFLDENIPVKKFKTYNKIYFRKPLSRIKKAKNPNQVDYFEIYQKKNIYYQVYLKKEEVLFIDEKISVYEKVIRNAKEYTLNSIDTYIPNPNNAALAKAMLIGYKNTLEKQTVQAFVDTGLIHILAVSGMHVGLILILVKIILKLFGWKENKLIILRSFIVILSLVFYAVLTGLSASVLRAVLMFSILELGNLSRQKYNPYNSLATSALILLMYNPNEIYNLGFLLSYGAMLGIFWFYQPLKKLLYFKNKIIDQWIWSVICLSIAAQLGTLSISLFYFHQFPTYFLLANVLILPILVPLITYGSVMLVAVSFIPFIVKMVGVVVDECIYLTIDLVKMMQQLPYAKINFIFLDMVEFITLSLLIIVLSGLAYEYKKSKAYMFLIIAVFGLSYNIIQFIIVPQSNFTVYYQTHKTSFSIQEKYSAKVFLEEKDEVQDKLFYSQIIEPSLRRNGILFIKVFSLKDWENSNKDFNKEFILIRNNKYSPVDSADHSLAYIISADNSYSFNKKETQYLQKMKVPFHSILQQNAFEFSY